MVVLLETAADHPAPDVEADMRPWHCADKLDNNEWLVQYIKQ
jgi:hypothetical protein